jgi:hypothetical protein
VGGLGVGERGGEWKGCGWALESASEPDQGDARRTGCSGFAAESLAGAHLVRALRLRLVLWVGKNGSNGDAEFVRIGGALVATWRRRVAVARGPCHCFCQGGTVVGRLWTRTWPGAWSVWTGRVQCARISGQIGYGNLAIGILVRA